MNKVSFISYPDGTKSINYGEVRVIIKDICDERLKEIEDATIEEIREILNTEFKKYE